jgi:hypothetical protein
MNKGVARLFAPGLLAAGLLAGCTAEQAPVADGVDIVTIDVPSGFESMSPNLAAGPDRSVVLSWLEENDAEALLKFSRLVDDAWSEPQTIARGENWFVNWADFPSVVPITAELWAAHWLVSNAEPWYAYDINVVLSRDSGRTWSEPFVPHRDGTDTEHGFVTLYPNETGVGLVWLDGRNMSNVEHGEPSASGMTLRSASLSPELAISNEQLVDGLICDCCQTDVAVTDDGAVAIYRDRTSDEIRDIYVTRHDGTRWREGKPVANDNWNIPGCPVNGPAIGADGNRLAVVWFSADDDVSRVQVAFSEDAGESFSSPVDAAGEETLGRVGLAPLPDGDFAVSWLRRAGTESAEFCIRRVRAGGGMGPVRVIAAGDDIPRFSFPRIVPRGNDLIVAWTRRIDGVSEVASARVSVGSL